MPPVRRLTAILAADVAGYSRLMGADEEGTHERLKAHLGELVEPKIAEHRGRIVKNTGDGFLAEFQSVVDAVRCAVEVQRGMAEANAATPPDKRIEFRVGISSGGRETRSKPLRNGPESSESGRRPTRRGAAAGLAHGASPAAKRRPDNNSSRCSGFRR
jgi:hypothetical protein